MTLPVLIDCDPGKDDAMAIFFALALSEKLDVLAITTVAGNVPVSVTSENACRILEAAGRVDILVYPGCPTPIMRKLQTAEHVHGMDGLGGSGLPYATTTPEDYHAVWALTGFLDETDTRLSIAALGPLTNIAMLLIERPDLVHKISSLVIMGGSLEGGNVTPHAEFNVYVDPHAAQIVLNAGLPVTFVTLDTTRHLRPDQAWFDEIREYGLPGEAVAGMWREAPVPFHDLAAVGYLAWPELYTVDMCNIAIMCEDGPEIGKMAIEPGGVECEIVTGLDRAVFLERVARVMETYRPLPESSAGQT